MRIGVIGAGSWGTTVASLAAPTNDTVIWARRPEVADEIACDHRNEAYLPGTALDPALRATTDFEEAVAGADVLVLAPPTQGFRAVLEQVACYATAGTPVVSLAKGLEPGTGCRMTELVRAVAPTLPAGVLTGPNIANELAGGYAAAAVVAFDDHDLAARIQHALRTRLFRLYTSSDVAGAELSGALKNVFAIAAGMAQGLDAGDNTRAAVLSRSLREMVSLGVAEGGQPDTFAGLAGLGDLLATSMSPSSRNRSLGEALAGGASVEEATAGSRMVVEGVRTAPVVMALAEQHGLCLPIAQEVNAVVRGERSAHDAFRGLLRSTPSSELVPG